MSTRVLKNGAKSLSPQNLQLVPKLGQDCCLALGGPGSSQQVSLSHTRSGWFSNCCLHWTAAGWYTSQLLRAISGVTAACGVDIWTPLVFRATCFGGSVSVLKVRLPGRRFQSFHSWRNSLGLSSRLWVTAVVYGEIVSRSCLPAQCFICFLVCFFPSSVDSLSFEGVVLGAGYGFRGNVVQCVLGCSEFRLSLHHAEPDPPYFFSFNFISFKKLLLICFSDCEFIWHG